MSTTAIEATRIAHETFRNMPNSPVGYLEHIFADMGIYGNNAFNRQVRREIAVVSFLIPPSIMTDLSAEEENLHARLLACLLVAGKSLRPSHDMHISPRDQSVAIEITNAIIPGWENDFRIVFNAEQKDTNTIARAIESLKNKLDRDRVRYFMEGRNLHGKPSRQRTAPPADNDQDAELTAYTYELNERIRQRVTAGQHMPPSA